MNICRIQLVTGVLGLLLLPLSAAAYDGEASIHGTIGFGLSFVGPDDHRTNDVEGRGLLLQGEYVFETGKPATPRLYLGAILTETDESSCGDFEPCDVSSKAVFGGAKVRLTAPIPVVSPFLELGAGLTLGSVKTQVGTLYDEDSGGAAFHIPVSLGLTIGRERRFDISFDYLMYPTLEHIDGAMAVKFTVLRN